MSVIATCRRCGHEFEPDGASIRAGTWRDGCPHCRPPGTPQQDPAPIRLPRTPRARVLAELGPEAA